MTDSILDDTKKALGISTDYAVFDPDITMHINSVFVILNQLGIGPINGFAITDSSDTWASFTANDLLLNSIKSYMYLRVKLMFDPPTTLYLLEALKDQFREIEYRLSIYRESTEWMDPFPIFVVDDVFT